MREWNRCMLQEIAKAITLLSNTHYDVIGKLTRTISIISALIQLVSQRLIGTNLYVVVFVTCLFFIFLRQYV